MLLVFGSRTDVTVYSCRLIDFAFEKPRFDNSPLAQYLGSLPNVYELEGFEVNCNVLGMNREDFVTGRRHLVVEEIVKEGGGGG